MDILLLFSSLLRVGFALLAMGAVVFSLRGLDKMLGIHFSVDVWPILRREPVALALYFGLRILAAAMLLGAVLA